MSEPTEAAWAGSGACVRGSRRAPAVDVLHDDEVRRLGPRPSRRRGRCSGVTGSPPPGLPGGTARRRPVGRELREQDLQGDRAPEEESRARNTSRSPRGRSGHRVRSAHRSRCAGSIVHVSGTSASRARRETTAGALSSTHFRVRRGAPSSRLVPPPLRRCRRTARAAGRRRPPPRPSGSPHAGGGRSDQPVVVAGAVGVPAVPVLAATLRLGGSDRRRRPVGDDAQHERADLSAVVGDVASSQGCGM